METEEAINVVIPLKQKKILRKVGNIMNMQKLCWMSYGTQALGFSFAPLKLNFKLL